MVSLKVLNGDLENGKTLFDDVCAECHGEDGRLIRFRYEGQEIILGKLAVRTLGASFTAPLWDRPRR